MHLPVNKNSSTSFHLSGAQCSNCQEIVMVFGNELMPITCPNCQAVGKIGPLLWSHFVESKTIVTDLMGSVGGTQSPADTVAP